ncbi:hypothetical protein SARC_16983, partial [Sphaeroforma arctica JP610]
MTPVNALTHSSRLRRYATADQHELFKGEFVPRPLTYTVEGQKFTLAGSTVPVPGQ